MVTFRSVFFGLVGVFLLSGLSSFHDSVVGGTPMIGNQIPVGAFVYFMFLGIVWNGGWELFDKTIKARGRLRDRFALSQKEFVLVMAATLVACFPPTSGLFRYFHRQLMLPWHYLAGRVEWQKYGLLTECLRPELFPEPWPGAKGSFGPAELDAYGKVYTGFFTGLAGGGGPLPLSELPLKAWIRPMLYWSPLLVAMSIALLSLQIVVHRQWAHHEQLSYPIAQVTGAFCRRADGRPGIPDLFGNRLFWCGFIPVFCILGIDHLSAWFPQSIPPLSSTMPNLRSWDLPVTNTVPFLKNAFSAAWFLNNQTLFFTFLGISYFVSSEISLTVGLSPFLLVFLTLLFHSATGTVMSDTILGAERAGATLGYTAILLYTGRTYFKAVFLRALGFGRSARNIQTDAEDDPSAPDEAATAAARVLILSFAVFVMVLSWMCQSWLVALFYAILAFALLLVVSRVVCETGIPFIQPGWSPASVICNLMGPAAIGPFALTFIEWGTAILVQDPRESLMPYVGTAAKLADDSGVGLRKAYRWAVAALAIALVTGFLSTCFSIYNYNPMTDSWASRWTPTMYLDETARMFGDMESAGTLAPSAEAGVLGRLSLLKPDAANCHWMIFGALAVLAVSALRFRFSKFPLHPIFFLFAGTFPFLLSWWSFLLGWLVKQLVVRFGGGGVYQKCKPLFIGLAAGEISMAGVSLLVGFIHYAIYGSGPAISGLFLPA